MTPIKRRHFLQVAGSTLATLGLSQLDVQRQGDRYAKVLAQSTPRKLALLVGINEYRTARELKGCLTDVELQRQLLVHRFGFKPQDILTLTDQKATRQGILRAFEEHLIKQAKPGDVVVFHFSGHGSSMSDRPDCDYPEYECLNSTFVPIDSQLPAGFPQQGGVVEDIMGHTLFLLMAAVPTENITVVLDSCHSGGGTRGNVRVRSREGGPQLRISPAEKVYQSQWLSRLELTPQKFIQRRRQGVAKGVVIASAARDQLAADEAFGDFYAGAFTYLMTQYLWQATSNQTVGNAFTNIARSTTRISSKQQEPLMEAKPNSNQQKPVYFTNPRSSSAEAVITKVNGKRADLWLGGLGPGSLEAFKAGTTFTIVNANGRSSGQAMLQSRRGLIGEALLEATAPVGTLLQEAVRTIPNDLKLRIGLDPSLEDDTASARQALQAIDRLEAVPSRPGTVPYQGEVQYILGRMTAANLQKLQQSEVNPPPQNSIGLFSQELEPVPGSFGAPEETVAAAVARLKAKFRSLLAARLVKLTLNGSSSRLIVAASLSLEAQKSQLIAEAFAVRGITQQASATPTKPAAIPADSRKIPVGTSTQLRVTNNELQPLYVSVLVIEPTGEITVVFPNEWAATKDATQVEANTTLLIPDAKDAFTLRATEPRGVAEMLVIASRSPLDRALKTLQAIAQRRELRRDNSTTPIDRGPLAPAEPVKVVSDLLDDLSDDTRSPSAKGQEYNLDTSQMATLSITFEVV